MYDILKAICEANNWPFIYGRSDFQNLFEDSGQLEKPHIFLDPITITENKNDSEIVETKTYSGLFMILFSSKLDEKSYNDRYQDYIKPILNDALILVREYIRCGFKGIFNNWNITEAINILDYNFDGIIVNYSITLDAKLFEETFTLTIAESESGTILQNPTGATFTQGSLINLAAFAEAGYRFKNWLLNGATKIANPLSFFMTKNYSVVPEFIKTWLLTTSVSGNGTITPDSGTYDDGDLVTITAEPINPLTDELESIEVNSVEVATTSPYQFNISAFSEVVAYFRELSQLVQKFFTGVGDISGNELVDHSGNVNAQIWGTCLKSDSGIIKPCGISPQLQIDLTQEGIWYEVIGNIAVGYDQMKPDSCVAGTLYGIRIRNNGVIFQFACDQGVIALVFLNITSVVDDTPFRYRLRRVGTDIICEKTTVADENYTSVLLTETKSIAAYTGLQNLIVKTITGITTDTAVYYQICLQGTYFNFDGVFSNNSNVTWSSTNSYEVNINTNLTEGNFKEQNVFIPSLKGFTEIYTNLATNSQPKTIVPYSPAGVSNIANIIALAGESNIGYNEVPANKLGLSWGFKLNISLLASDFGNTYFNISNDANLIRSNSQPTKLDNRIYWDRANKGEILIYDSVNYLSGSFNTVNKKLGISGDSTAAAAWNLIIEIMTGSIRTNVSWGGATTAQIQANIEAELISNPTLISSSDWWCHISGFNDYPQNLTDAQFTTDYTNLVQLLRTENPTMPLFLLMPYDYYYASNPTADPTLPNIGGMTYNSMRSIIQTIADGNNAIAINLNLIGLIRAIDFTDGIHTYQNSGGIKIANKVFEEINNYLI